ncbi:hypothetical protein [Buttiauxella agrestis]|uniref:hypothetical protein n=1 Tax=Buttiauxella agrestis TaxID=82977 RepID=UPI0039770833
MITNRMGLEQTLSDERLEEVANIGSTEHMAFPPSHAQCAAMARELLAYRKASKEPVAWTDEVELRGVEKDGCGYLFKANPITPHADPRRVIMLYTAPPIQVATVPDEVTFDQAMLEVHGLSPAEAFQKAWSHLRESILKSVTNEP